MSTLAELSRRFFDVLKLKKCGQIGANDLLCFEKALDDFLASGAKEDAFVVYFCFSEIFGLFGKGYENAQKLLETLSDHEYHTGELLAKHRDHYSHSVYVFALGLAVYACDGAYRRTFDRFYGYREGGAMRFLRYWGMTALFHDIGYPFQLVHEQLKVYSKELWGDGVSNPYVSFGNMPAFLALDGEVGNALQKALGAPRAFADLNELFAYALHLRQGYGFAELCDLLARRVVCQPKFMDHGYFSAVILARKSLDNARFSANAEWLDVLGAILLHNNLNKYDIAGAHRIAPQEQPLAYLLILCDELQAWDRLSYGKVSKRDPIAWDVSLRIGENSVEAEYCFDSAFVDVYEDGAECRRPNKSYCMIRDGEFVKEIGKFIDAPLSLTATATERVKNKRTQLYASDNRFINLCDFAKAIHAAYDEHCREKNIEYFQESFGDLPLEFKVSNIRQAISYAPKLELINCFYSAKDLDYPVVEDFNGTDGGKAGADNVGFLCREEHVRWVREKLSLGWRYGTDYSTTAERNAKKVHRGIVPYEMLTEEEQSKDELMIRNIIPLLRRFDSNIRIYNYRAGRKPDLEIGGFGHRKIGGGREALKEQIRSILLAYASEYRVVVRTCFAAGADQLIAECAAELGITIKAVLPMEYEEYIRDVRRDAAECGRRFDDADELRMRHLLAQTAVCKVVADPQFVYAAASRYIIDRCAKAIVLWDGKTVPLFDEQDNPIHRGGTYHTVCLLQERGLRRGEDIHCIDCGR